MTHRNVTLTPTTMEILSALVEPPVPLWVLSLPFRREKDHSGNRYLQWP